MGDKKNILGSFSVVLCCKYRCHCKFIAHYLARVKQVTKKRWRDFLIAKIWNLFLVVCNFFISCVKHIAKCASHSAWTHIEAQLSQNKKGVFRGAFFSSKREREREKIHKVFQMYDESRTNVPATYSVNHVSYFLFYFLCAYCALLKKPSI